MNSAPVSFVFSGCTSLTLALIVGGIGGYCFYWLTLPLPWMIGAMVFTSIATTFGMPLRMAPQLRLTMIATLGIMLGSAFTPALFEQLGQWSVSLALLVAYVGMSTFLCELYFRRIAGYGPVSAYFASAPGGLNEMTQVGAQKGGDARQISLCHAARILLIVLIVSFSFRFFGNYHPEAKGLNFSMMAPLLSGWKEWGLLALAGGVGLGLALWLRMPAAGLVGPMIASAIIHVTGLTDSRPPDILIALAQLIVGTGLGCRFYGAPPGLLLRVLGHAVMATLILMAITLGMAGVIAQLVGIPFHAAILALAPGGVAEMSLIALSLGLDPAYVAAHHISRISMVVLVIPLLFPWYQRWINRPQRHVSRQAE